MPKTGEELRDIHNQGEQDAAAGESKTGLFGEYGALADALNSASDDYQAEKDAYVSGETNANKQKE